MTQDQTKSTDDNLFIDRLDTALGVLEEKIQSAKKKKRGKPRPHHFSPIEFSDEEGDSLHAKVYEGDIEAIKKYLPESMDEKHVAKELRKRLDGAGVPYFVLFSKEPERAKVLAYLLSRVHSSFLLDDLLRDLNNEHWNIPQVILERNFIDLWCAMLRSFRTDACKFTFLLKADKKGINLAHTISQGRFASLYLKITLQAFSSEKSKIKFLTQSINENDQCIFDLVFPKTEILVDVLNALSEASIEELLNRPDPEMIGSYFDHIANDVIHEDLCSCSFDRFNQLMKSLPEHLRLKLLNTNYDECFHCAKHRLGPTEGDIFPITPFESLFSHCARLYDALELLRSINPDLRHELLFKKNKKGLMPLFQAIEDFDIHAVYAILANETLEVRREMMQASGPFSLNAVEFAIKEGHLDAVTIMAEMIK